MASLAQCACGAGVANLNLVAMCQAVPDLVLSRFSVALVRGAETGFCHWGRRRWCRRGWDNGGAHSCDGKLDVGNGFGERCVGGHRVLNGGILLNDCVYKIVKRRSHLLFLIKFGGLISAKRCVSSSHAIDDAHFGKGGGPMGLPVGPSVVERQATFLLAPVQHHVAAR